MSRAVRQVTIEIEVPVRHTIHIALLGCLTMLGCDRQPAAPALPAPATEESNHASSEADYRNAMLVWYDQSRFKSQKIAWLEHIARAEALDRAARDAWLEKLYTRIEWLKSDQPDFALYLPPAGSTDPLLERVIEALINSHDGVVRYAAARCLLADLPEAEAGLDMAAYWLGEEVERYRGPRVDRGFVTMKPPEAAVVMLLARARMRTLPSRGESTNGLTPQQQGVSLMRIAGWAFGIDALPNDRAWRAIGLPADFGSRRGQASDVAFSRERPLRWLPPPVPPYQLERDPRARGERSPLALDHDQLNLFDRIRQRLEASETDTEAWEVLLRFGRDDAPAVWQDQVRHLICAQHESAIPAMLNHGGAFCDQALFSRVVLALGPSAIGGLTEGLTYEDPAARAAAARGLAIWGEEARGAAPALRQIAQHDPDDYARFQAHRALDAMQPR